MSVLPMLSPLSRNANGRMSSGQLAKSSFVKMNVESRPYPVSTSSVPLTVGTVKVRFIQRFCLFTVFSDVKAVPGPA